MLVLASASPRRRELLSRLGVEFEVRPPSGVDESGARGSAFSLCQELARQKAEWVLASFESGSEVPTPGREEPIVLGSDTVVAIVRGGQERVLGKPASREDAARTLALLSGQSHRVLTGVAIARPGRPTHVEIEVTQVRFRSLTPAEIDAYVASGESDDKAGSYAIQGAGGGLVESIRGCFNNVVGLPIGLVARMLGIDPSAACACRQCELQERLPEGTPVGCHLLDPAPEAPGPDAPPG